MATNGTNGKEDFAERLGLMPGSFGIFRKWWILLPTIIVGLGLVTVTFCTTYIRPNEYGVLRVRFGFKKGIRKKIYKAGLHFVIPSWEIMYRFPKNFQILQRNKNYRKLYNFKGNRSIPPIRIQTSEGYEVTADITIQYRITNPYLVMKKIGPHKAYENLALIPRSENILRQELGKLNAEQFYRGPERIKGAEEARRKLNVDLKDKGIEVVSVLVMEFSYDARYQNTIEKRKLQDQQFYLRRAEKIKTIEEKKKDVTVEKWAAKVKAKLAYGDKRVAEIEAAGSLYKRQRLAQGYLLKKLAEAKGIELENRAMESSGSEYLVALKMAEVLKGIEVLVLPSNGQVGFNPLNLGRTLSQLTVKVSEAAKKKHSLPIKQLKLPSFKSPNISLKMPKSFSDGVADDNEENVKLAKPKKGKKKKQPKAASKKAIVKKKAAAPKKAVAKKTAAPKKPLAPKKANPVKRPAPVKRLAVPTPRKKPKVQPAKLPKKDKK